MSEPEEEWIEVHRGLRRSSMIVIRALIDAGVNARDARRLKLSDARSQDGVVQVPKSQLAHGQRVMETLKKHFPHVFVAGSGKGD